METQKKKIKILLVDDQQEIVDLYTEFLESEYQIITATSVDEAFKRYKENPDLNVIVSDLKMPGGNGLFLVNEFILLDPDIPIIVLTGYADKESVISSMKNGVFDFLEKPIDLSELDRTIARALRFHEIIRKKKKLLQTITDRVSTLENRCKQSDTVFSRLSENTEQLKTIFAPWQKAQEKILSEILANSNNNLLSLSPEIKSEITSSQKLLQQIQQLLKSISEDLAINNPQTL